MKLFRQSSPLPKQYELISSKIAVAERALAAGLPAKRIYTQVEVDAFDLNSRFPSLHVWEALVEMGILASRTTKRCPETNFGPEDGWHDNEEGHWLEETRYEVVLTLATLIDGLKQPRVAPYFISFDTTHGTEATKDLDSVFRSSGLTGFISPLLQSGQWREDIVMGLRASRTVFLVETPMFHTRPRCKVERDFAVASGSIVVRLGVCPRSTLHDEPTWLGDLTYSCVEVGGKFDMAAAMGLTIPPPVTLELRRRAAHSLVERCSPDMVTQLSSKLGISDQVYGSLAQQRVTLVDVSFGADTRADRFCAEFDLLACF